MMLDRPTTPSHHQAAELSRSMRAAVLTGGGRMAVERTVAHAPTDGEVRVRNEGCGVCASNLGPWAGPDWMAFPTLPGSLGHEAWGTVDAVGPGVKGLAPGDRVATLFQNSYAEYDVGPASHVVRLPHTLSGMPFPAEPLGCAVNIFRRSGVEAGQWVAIVGIGFLGAILIRLAKHAGARVIAISRRRYAQDLARQLGAGVVMADDRHEAAARIDEITGGALCPVVIEATGKQAPLDLAGDLVGERGRLVIAGYHQDGPRLVDMQQWNWRGIDVINAHERDPAMYVRGMREAVTLVQEAQIDLSRLLTHSVPLDRLGDALDMTRDRPDGFLKAWVRF
jgi:threonine dehydrogenase-like Zn-dependent dehydrogenase